MSHRLAPLILCLHPRWQRDAPGGLAHRLALQARPGRQAAGRQAGKRHRQAGKRHRQAGRADWQNGRLADAINSEHAAQRSGSPQPAAHGPQPPARRPQPTATARVRFTGARGSTSPGRAAPAHSPQPAASSTQPQAHRPQATASDSLSPHQGAHGGGKRPNHGDAPQQPEVGVEEGLDVEVWQVLEQQVEAKEGDCRAGQGRRAGQAGRAGRHAGRAGRSGQAGGRGEQDEG